MNISHSVKISLQGEKKTTKFLLNKKNYFLLLNEEIELLLRFKKKFHKYLSNYMLHRELRKGRE